MNLNAFHRSEPLNRPPLVDRNLEKTAASE
jgi:hypothetical protein